MDIGNLQQFSPSAQMYLLQIGDIDITVVIQRIQKENLVFMFQFTRSIEGIEMSWI